MSKNLGWFFIIIGGICEIFWVSGLKYADTLGLQALTGLGICISFVCMLLAIRVIEISVAYSVFVGIGAAGIVLAEIVVFGAPASWLKITLIVVLMCGVIGLKFATNHKGA
ncbi:DMT family transporter [Helicobacter zhangjianzhongii]|uniref:Multidrug efflux SMR transporter n=1 Tax=Helicobacter zhangjianzhongii TaxID=2974574 RepID=A0ACC6FQE1_9HELI|nr:MULTISPECIES: multidrug efflux SMR transporter [unclassified Helicobacter]MDL0079360.1 multidrug efflux SMR transporter [Helicobacter sp. CPD2-1]MDL0081389.1 multidrug efflux SMR transporter [Helicobacter sp. XJK30-2]